MGRFAGAGVGLLAILTTVVSASAADLAARPYTKAPAPIAAMYDWSGFYIGVNGGGGWSRNCWDIVTNVFGAPVVPAAPEGCHTATGAVAGGQLGYRWQSGAWVFGLEGQGDWANLSGSNGPSLLAGGGGSDRTKIDALGLVTGQVGYAWSNVLFYVKGGGMVARDKYEGFFTATGGVFDKASETRWGGAVGAGLDFGVAPNVVVGVDYVHGFMGSRNRFGGPIIAKY